MKFELAFDRTFPHPVEAVWRAITEREALAAWLMETDFAPEIGRAFHMWCEDAKGHTDTYLCRVVEFEPPRRMVWSWVLEGREGEGATSVEFVLEVVPEGTRLTVRHTGDRDRETIEAFKGGWPVKLGQLEAALGGAARR